MTEDGRTVFEHACRLGAEGTSPSGWTAPIDLGFARSGLRSAIPQASLCRGSAARIGTDDLRDWGSVEIVVGPSAGGVWRMRWGRRRADRLPRISVSRFGKQSHPCGLLPVGLSAAPQTH